MASPFDNSKVRCPICRKQVPFNDPEMPFCSERCRIVDLGHWADGTYKISTPAYQSELEEDLPEPHEGKAR